MLTDFLNRSSALLACSFAAAASIAHADNQIPYLDAAFANADWSITNYGTLNATASQNANGFIGTCRRVVHPLNGSGNLSVHHKFLAPGATLDPASGAISSISFSIKAKFLSGTGSVGHSLGVAIEQNGIAYYSTGLTTGVSGDWVTRSGTYTVVHFLRFDGQPGSPDFSTSGAPITFGYRTFNSGGIAINQTVLYDDLVIIAHRNTVLVSDSDFAPADWTITPFVTGSGGTATATQSLSDGDPIPCRRVVHAMNGGTASLRAFHKFLPIAGTIDPSQGAIDRIDMSLDARYVSGVRGNGHQIGVALEQDGIAYHTSGQTTGSSGAWLTRQSMWSKASDFIRFDGLAGSPDFSLAGAPIQLGFRTANATQIGDGAFNQIVQYDNWSVRVHFVSCACDLNADGLVEDSDFVQFAVAYDLLDCTDPNMPSGCPADVNSDGFVDDFDFVLFAIAYDLLECP